MKMKGPEPDLPISVQGYVHFPKVNAFLIQAHSKAKTNDGIDWRWKGVTDVQFQGKCGSCWTYSSSDTIIGRLAIAGKEKLQ